MTRSAVLLIAALLLWAAPARAAKPARFQAGAVVRSLAPPVPVYAGGFGTSPPITSQHDPLQARAMVIRNGSRAVGFAIVDAQAYFAAYQEDPRVGITAVREDAAAAIARATGVRMTADDIIVQSTHSHAAPTLEGIWGPVPPAYLKLVHDRTVDALVAAARRARPALLQSGTVDAPFLDNVAIQQTDSYPGWTQDGQLSVLRAVAPRSRRTIATFANVPAHADIVCGSCLKTLSADYFGAVRAALDRRLGGTSLVTPATLGREESPVQTAGLEAMTWYARGVSGLVARALARARWVTDPTLAGAGAMTDIPGTNPLLLALVAANRLPAGAKQSFADQSGQYPIDRADAPPYLTGSVIGTPLSAVRVGDLAYLSMPGEPFPEIRDALRRATGPRARLVVALSKGQDDLGYFYPAFVTPFTSTYPSDHLEFNVAPQAGDQILLGQAANLRAVGFDATTPVGRPLPTDTGAASRPAVQALAAPAAGDVGRGGRSRRRSAPSPPRPTRTPRRCRPRCAGTSATGQRPTPRSWTSPIPARTRSPPCATPSASACTTSSSPCGTPRAGPPPSRCASRPSQGSGRASPCGASAAGAGSACARASPAATAASSPGAGGSPTAPSPPGARCGTAASGARR